jgi:hypothetical protein
VSVGDGSPGVRVIPASRYPRDTGLGPDFTADFWLHPYWTLRVLDERGTEIVSLNLSGNFGEKTD